MKFMLAVAISLILLGTSRANPDDFVKELQEKWEAKVVTDEKASDHPVVEIQFHCTSNVPDEVIARLTRFPKLKILGLVGGQELTDEGLKQIAKLNGLEELSIRNEKISSAGLNHLTGLTSLKKLLLWDVKLTAEAAKQLESFPALEELKLRNVSGDSDGLASLAKCQKLKKIDGFRCKGIFDAKAADTRKALPGVEVILRD